MEKECHTTEISIHALREEGDSEADRLLANACNISIHALREEGDLERKRGGQPGNNFYPRPPRGGRRIFCKLCAPGCKFLSTPSARRAT